MILCDGRTDTRTQPFIVKDVDIIDHFDGALSANETDYLRRIRAFPGIQ